MVFSSEIFLFIFLPITLLFYLIFKRGRNIILLIASLIFYYIMVRPVNGGRYYERVYGKY